MSQPTNVVLNITKDELTALSAIFTFESADEEENESGVAWKSDLSDKIHNESEDEDSDITDAEDLVDQLAVKISHLVSLASV